ncbi:Scrn1 [Lemmus lemmus]
MLLISVRLGLERGTTAKEALDIIVSLLDKHGQGGNYYEDAHSCHSFQSAYLLVDRDEAWVLETVGKYWAAERITEGVRCICNQLSLTTKMDEEHPKLRTYAQSQGWWTGEDEFNFAQVFSPADDHLDCCAGKDSLEKQEAPLPSLPESITVQTMINILRDKASGVCIDSESFLTTASIVSVLPQNRSSPCIHYFTGTPDPSRSIFKPFIFVDDVKLVPKAQSPCFGDDDPAKKEPRFQEKPDRRHELYKAHEWARAVIESDQVSLEEVQGGGRRSTGRRQEGGWHTHSSPLFSQKEKAGVNFPVNSPESKPNETSAFVVTLNPAD